MWSQFRLMPSLLTKSIKSGKTAHIKTSVNNILCANILIHDIRLDAKSLLS